jgi:uncharacterized protein (DUF342 family)
MDEMREQHHGALLVERDMAVYGHVTGSAFVLGSATLHLYGLVEGDLVAEASSVIVVHGTVQGAVINSGGDVSIFGTVGSVTGTHPSRVELGGVVLT